MADIISRGSLAGLVNIRESLRCICSVVKVRVDDVLLVANSDEAGPLPGAVRAES